MKTFKKFLSAIVFVARIPAIVILMFAVACFVLVIPIETADYFYHFHGKLIYEYPGYVGYAPLSEQLGVAAWCLGIPSGIVVVILTAILKGLSADK